MIEVGAASVEYEVPAGTPMAGFAARTAGSVGVHDALSARAIVFEDVALVAIDCCALHEDDCAEIRTELVGLGLREAVVAATHTHAGPCIATGRLGVTDAAVLANAQRAAVEAGRQALENRRPAELVWGEAFGVGVAKNRRHFDRQTDPALSVLKALDADGSVVASLVSYPCHPVVLDGTNLEISADYVGYLRSSIQAAWPGAVCVFLTGAAGDVNTGHRAEDSFTGTPSATRTFAEAQRVGELLGSAAVAASVRPIEVDQVGFVSAAVELPFEQLDPAQVAAEADGWRAQLPHVSPAEAEVLRVWIDWAETWHPDDADAPWRGRVGCVRLGELLIACLPGEPFLATAEAVAALQPGPTLTLGYCDGVPGYLPVLDEYQHGGYEVRDAHRYYAMPAPFAAGCAETLVAAVREVADAG